MLREATPHGAAGAAGGDTAGGQGHLHLQVKRRGRAAQAPAGTRLASAVLTLLQRDEANTRSYLVLLLSLPAAVLTPTWGEKQLLVSRFQQLQGISQDRQL